MVPYCKQLFFLIFIVLSFTAAGQQLYIEGFTARQRTNFDTSPYQDKKIWYSPLGIRLAGGADKIQIGGEFRFNLKDPTWTIKDSITEETLGSHKFISSYYGALVRVKFSRYPARRLGITIMIGAGFTNMERQSTISTELASVSYDRTPTYNGNIGVSIPTGGPLMVELGYSYFLIDFSEKQELAAMAGSFHSFHLGLSYNLVFGERALEYDKILKN